MLQTLRNAWRIEDLRKKILFTLFIVLLFRLGNAIPVPHINVEALQAYFTQVENTVLGLYNVMSGGAFSTATIFALSIQPYINASIIMQLLTIASPALERLSKEGGEEGKKKIQRIIRCTTLVLAAIMAFGYYVTLKSYGVLTRTDVWSGIVIIITMVAGSMFTMWLGDQITENGISIILLVGIVSQGLHAVSTVLSLQWWAIIVIVAICLAIIAFIVFITEAERRIPVQYAKRVVGRKQYGGQSTHLPMKVNMSGVMPVIFASTICGVPATIAGFSGKTEGFWYNMTNEWFAPNAPAYIIIYVLLIFAFAYFYSTIQFNPIEVANNMKKNGGFIPGFRPGKPTSDFIKKVLGKITMMGAIFLAIIAALPQILSNIPSLGALGIGGTTTLIMVSVSLETVRAIEGELMMRHYKGFLE